LLKSRTPFCADSIFGNALIENRGVEWENYVFFPPPLLQDFTSYRSKATMINASTQFLNFIDPIDT
jgi:hypothetical protein